MNAPSLRFSPALKILNNLSEENFLKALGPASNALSASVVLHRDLSGGAWSAPEDILQVPGIGPQKFQRVLDYCDSRLRAGDLEIPTGNLARLWKDSTMLGPVAYIPRWAIPASHRSRPETDGLRLQPLSKGIAVEHNGLMRLNRHLLPASLIGEPEENSSEEPLVIVGGPLDLDLERIIDEEDPHDSIMLGPPYKVPEWMLPAEEDYRKDDADLIEEIDEFIVELSDQEKEKARQGCFADPSLIPKPQGRALPGSPYPALEKRYSRCVDAIQAIIGKLSRQKLSALSRRNPQGYDQAVLGLVRLKSMAQKLAVILQLRIREATQSQENFSGQKRRDMQVLLAVLRKRMLVLRRSVAFLDSLYDEDDELERILAQTDQFIRLTKRKLQNLPPRKKRQTRKNIRKLLQRIRMLVEIKRLRLARLRNRLDIDPKQFGIRRGMETCQAQMEALLRNLPYLHHLLHAGKAPQRNASVTFWGRYAIPIVQTSKGPLAWLGNKLRKIGKVIKGGLQFAWGMTKGVFKAAAEPVLLLADIFRYLALGKTAAWSFTGNMAKMVYKQGIRRAVFDMAKGLIMLPAYLAKSFMAGRFEEAGEIIGGLVYGRFKLPVKIRYAKEKGGLVVEFGKEGLAKLKSYAKSRKKKLSPSDRQALNALLKKLEQHQRRKKQLYTVNSMTEISPTYSQLVREQLKKSGSKLTFSTPISATSYKNFIQKIGAMSDEAGVMVYMRLPDGRIQLISKNKVVTVDRKSQQYKFFDDIYHNQMQIDKSSCRQVNTAKKQYIFVNFPKYVRGKNLSLVTACDEFGHVLQYLNGVNQFVYELGKHGYYWQHVQNFSLFGQRARNVLRTNKEIAKNLDAANKGAKVEYQLGKLLHYARESRFLDDLVEAIVATRDKFLPAQ